MPDISLIASAIRKELFPDFMDSIHNTETANIEVIFAGPLQPESVRGIKNLTYIQTGNIKPAQCYEIARRHSTGEVIVWVADDCEFVGGVLTKAFQHWKSYNDKKIILSLQTKESGYGLPQGKLFDMNIHRFFGGRKDAPLMAPLGMISRVWLEELGGFDRRYICGQYENDVVMRSFSRGGTVLIFGDDKCFIDIDHLGKSIRAGECKGQMGFIKRPFAAGYKSDRAVLESTWWSGVRFYSSPKSFEPYDENYLYTQSQSNNISERWI